MPWSFAISAPDVSNDSSIYSDGYFDQNMESDQTKPVSPVCSVAVMALQSFSLEQATCAMVISHDYNDGRETST